MLSMKWKEIGSKGEPGSVCLNYSSFHVGNQSKKTENNLKVAGHGKQRRKNTVLINKFGGLQVCPQVSLSCTAMWQVLEHLNIGIEK